LLLNQRLELIYIENLDLIGFLAKLRLFWKFPCSNEEKSEGTNRKFSDLNRYPQANLKTLLNQAFLQVSHFEVQNSK
jgi:hypothetical protein